MHQLEVCNIYPPVFQTATNADLDYDEVLESMIEDTSLCKDCYKEEMADDDWYNWRD